MTEIEDDVEHKIRLAQQMKDTCCDESGKETNPAKAAEILHQIGLIYRKRSPDKISLIKNAGLLNAAIVRNPPNILQVKSDLSELCRHILKTSSAKKQNVDLVEKSREVKVAIEKLRNVVERFLKAKVPKIPNNIERKDLQQLKSHKISAVKEINAAIAYIYNQIMKKLCIFCEKIMGKPPCEYAIVGMGSLAREEITPYSDFEHIILLCDDKNYKLYLEYFQWFSVIFHIVVLNLQETIVPSLNIASLNDKESTLGNWFYDDVTPRGISFDGMMPHACKFPLGRQQHTKNKQFTTELIKPVSEMLEYLGSDADLKNGYHLADILTKTCYVFGNENIFKQFVEGTQNYRDMKSQTDTINDIKKQVREDLNNFSTRFRLSILKLQHTINIKQLVYRSTTLFISVLGRKHNISANSCFDIIDEMAENNHITQNTAEKLKFAIAIACEMRLRVYMDKKSQCDNAIDLKQDGIEKFLDIVGVACTINYFQIAYCLQCEVAKKLNFTKLHFYTDPQLINITIGLAFGISNITSFFKNEPNLVWDSKHFDFDDCVAQLEAISVSDKNLTIFGFSQSSTSAQSEVNFKKILMIANFLDKAGIDDEALEFYKQLLDFYHKRPVVDFRDLKVDQINHKIGHCLNRLDKPEEALTYLNRALQIRKNLSLETKTNRKIALTLNEIALCYIDIRNYSEALTNLNRALEIFKKTSLDIDTDKNVCRTFQCIGRCHIRLQNYDDALVNLYLALEIKRNTSPNVSSDLDIAWTLHEIGECHIRKKNYKKAIESLNQSLEINEKISRNVNAEGNIATIFHNLGYCHAELDNRDEALTSLKRALEIKQNATLNVDTDRGVANTLLTIGQIQAELHACDDGALSNLNRALEIYQNTTLNVGNDWFVAETLCNIGLYHIDLHNYDEALADLNRAFEMFQNKALNANTDRNVASTLSNIGWGHMHLRNYDEALSRLNQALESFQKLTFDANMDRSIARTLHRICVVYKKKQQYSQALNYFNRAMEIKLSTTDDVNNDSGLALTQNMINICLSHVWSGLAMQ